LKSYEGRIGKEAYAFKMESCTHYTMEDEEKTSFTKRHKIPTKMKDPDSFIVYCSIGGW
jgi:DNA-directed RNA polymerase beta' subunit